MACRAVWDYNIVLWIIIQRWYYKNVLSELFTLICDVSFSNMPFLFARIDVPTRIYKIYIYTTVCIFVHIYIYINENPTPEAMKILVLSTATASTPLCTAPYTHSPPDDNYKLALCSFYHRRPCACTARTRNPRDILRGDGGGGWTRVGK